MSEQKFPDDILRDLNARADRFPDQTDRVVAYIKSLMGAYDRNHAWHEANLKAHLAEKLSADADSTA